MFNDKQFCWNLNICYIAVLMSKCLLVYIFKSVLVFLFLIWNLSYFSDKIVRGLSCNCQHVQELRTTCPRHQRAPATESFSTDQGEVIGEKITRMEGKCRAGWNQLFPKQKKAQFWQLWAQWYKAPTSVIQFKRVESKSSEKGPALCLVERPRQKVQRR